MSGGHYGIDPRTKHKLVPDFKPIGSTYNNTPTRQHTSFCLNIPPSRPKTSLGVKKPVKHGYPLQEIVMPTTPRQNPKPSSEQPNIHQIFDSIISLSRSLPLNEAIENELKNHFHADVVLFWYVSTQDSCFYCPTRNQICDLTKSILSAVYGTNQVINLTKPSTHEYYDQVIDSETAPTMYIPISDEDNHVYGVIQIFHLNMKVFMTNDFSMAIALSKKFQSYSHFLFDTDKFKETVIDIDYYNEKNVIAFLIEKLQSHFNCRTVEFWIGDTEASFLRYDIAVNTYIRIIGNQPGVARRAFQNREILNIQDCTLSEDYFAEIDGEMSEPVLVVPYVLDSLPSAIILRGKYNTDRFTYADEIELKVLTPLILKCLTTTGSGSREEFSNRLKALLEVAETLGSVLDIDSLVPIIMERACLLLKTERCSLFLVDDKRENLITTYQTGLDQSIKVPISRGIVGHTATTGEIVNITDAYSDPRLDTTIDSETGFKSKTILSVPIYNNKGEIQGVTEMINKKEDLHFNDDDIKMMIAFNVFCGISLDNARLYNMSLDLTRQLKGFIEMSAAINATNTLKEIIDDILVNAKNAINATRATLFLKETDGISLSIFSQIGEPLKYGSQIADKIVQSRTAQIFTKETIKQMGIIDQSIKDNEKQENPTPENNQEAAPNQTSHTSTHEQVQSETQTKPASPTVSPQKPEKNKDSKQSMALDASSSFSSSSRIACALDFEDILAPREGIKQETICDFPLLTSDKCIIGVLEFASNTNILPEDFKLLECFSVFASVSIERDDLQKIAAIGTAEVETQKYIKENERKLIGTTPDSLQISEANQATIYAINFDAPFWDGIGHIRVIWNIFNHFQLLSEFKITNERFFMFLTTISHTYNKVPYHNWRHAVDVTQFTTYEIKTANLQDTFTKFELFGFLVAAICHDANHDGFTNVYNEKAETPLGILFKNQSVMETHHCTVAISVISKEECNIFENFNPNETKTIWNQIISLILSTDMAKHYEILKKINAILDQGPLDMTKEEHRFIAMQLVLKCGDISNVSRPFELANKWCDVLCEEFFRQGDLEMTSGMEYTSPLNDRAHLDKPKSQIGFYTYVCLPLYETAARAIPPLQVNVDQVKSNLEVWKNAAQSSTAQQEKK